LAEIIGARRAWTVAMISALSIPSKVHGCDPEVGVAELTLDDIQRYALPRHLDRMRMTQLMRREATPHAGLRGGAPYLLTHAGRRQRPPAGAAIDDTEQRTGRSPA
jgi:hypothetical protein